MIAGDFNAKAGMRHNKSETALGAHGRGTRNPNGEQMMTFAEQHGMILANTCFQHPHKHRTTWEGILTSGKKIYNQIDYVMVPHVLKSALRQARSHAGSLTDSDHRLVTCTLDMRQLYVKWSSINNSHKEQIAIQSLKSNANEFQKRVADNLASHRSSSNPKEKLEALNANLQKAAISTVGAKERKRVVNCNDVKDLSARQKIIRDQLRSAKSPEAIKELRQKRQALLKEIHRQTKLAAVRRIDVQVSQVDELKDDAKMFQAVQMLRTTIASKAVISDREGKFITSPQDRAETAASFFHSQLHDSSLPPFLPFDGAPRPLAEPVTIGEVEMALKKLKNNKAAGPDGIQAELYKYSGRPCVSQLVEIINETFATHIPIDVNSGILCPLQKPAKPKGPCTSLRPVILLNVVRKVLSIVALQRIRPKIDPLIKRYQAGFRRGRSTTEVVWTKRWMVALVMAYEIIIHSKGLDLSRAFDTVERPRLLQIIGDLPQVNDDEIRMVRLILADTKLQVRIEHVLSEAFDDNMGTLQGDSLSPFLFLTYLNEAMDKAAATFQIPLPILDQQLRLPDTTAFADDVDIYSTSATHVETRQKHLTSELASWNLKINEDKTEHITIKKDVSKSVCQGCGKKCTTDSMQCDSCDSWWHYGCSRVPADQIQIMTKDPSSTFKCPTCNNSSASPGNWKTVKSLGSLLGDREDINRRIQLASVAFRQHYKLWPRRKFMSLKTRMRVYNSFVLPVLTYNAGAMALSKQLEAKIDTFHRKQLRALTGTTWPNTIPNKNLYELTQTKPISQIARERRWVFFGHVCRLQPDTPARQIMHSFFIADTLIKRRSGRPASSIVRVLQEDLDRSFNKHHRILRTEKDLCSLEALAQSREGWKRLMNVVCAACV